MSFPAVANETSGPGLRSARLTSSSHLWENLPATPSPEELVFEDPELSARAAEMGHLKDPGPGRKWEREIDEGGKQKQSGHNRVMWQASETQMRLLWLQKSTFQDKTHMH